MGSLNDLREQSFDRLLPYSGLDTKDQDKEVAPGMRIAVWFLVAGLFIFVKEALFAVVEAVEQANNVNASRNAAPIEVLDELNDDSNSLSESATDKKSDHQERPEPPEFSDSGLSNLFSGRAGVFNPDTLAAGNTSPLLLAQNDNLSPQQSGSFNPFLTSDNGLIVLPNIVQPSAGGGGGGNIRKFIGI